MTLSEQVAELEKQVRAAADREEYYRNGLRAGLRGDRMTETDPDGVMDRGWREGDRLRRLVRMDLEGFRAGVLGETFGDGSDPAFVAGYHEGEKVRAEIVRLERAQAQSSRYPARFAGMEAAVRPLAPQGGPMLSLYEQTKAELLAQAEARVTVGNNPPEPEIGMVYRFGEWTCMVCALPHSWPDNLVEVRAPWGGAVVWRRA